MTDEQRATSVAAIAAAARYFHTQSGLASAIGKSTSHVSRLVAGDVLIDAVDAVTIDKRSNGKIPRHELRPDLWDPPRRSASLDRFGMAPRKMLEVMRGAGLIPGATVSIEGTRVDGQFSIVDKVLDVGKLAADATQRRAQRSKANGKTRTRKLEGKDEQKETRPSRRAAAQGRQGKETRGRKERKGKGRR